MPYKFMNKRKLAYSLSITLVVLSIILMITRGFKYGIDFRGGNAINITFKEPTNETAIKKAFTQIKKEIEAESAQILKNREGKTDEQLEAEVQAAQQNGTPIKEPLNFYFDPNSISVQPFSDLGDKSFLIQYPASAVEIRSNQGIHDAILKKLNTILPYSNDNFSTSNVGPTLGNEMKKQGIYSAILSIIGILLYLAYRFDFYSATGVVIAVVHDLFITLGFISLVGIEFDTTVLAAILTLLGYSVNDSIVIFDRIRENKRISKLTSYSAIVDESINQSISRTMNTTITTLLALLSLVILGGSSIQGFALTLTVGCIVGTYSSIAIAAPVVSDISGDDKVAKN